MSRAREIPDEIGPRLDKATADIEDLRRQLELALTRRDQIIVQADRDGWTQRAIARRAKVSQPHVLRIVAGTVLAAAG